MTEYKNDCVGCVMGFRGMGCPNKHVAHHYCDEREKEIEEEKIHYTEGGRELCRSCYNALEEPEDDED